jgi:hypothetical protein
MADPTPSGVENATAGHLSVHIEGQHPADVPFLFERQQSRMVSSTVAALVYHVGMALLLFFAIRYAPAPSAAGPFVPDRPSDQIIWLSATQIRS